MNDLFRNHEALFAEPTLEVEPRADGTRVLRSKQTLRAYPARLGEHLARWAHAAPDRLFLVERAADQSWRGVTYAEAYGEVQRVGAWLVDRGFSTDRPVALLSDNSIEHALMMLAAMHVGLPAMPLSSAYSLMTRDYEKLRSILEQTQPGVLFVESAETYSKALEALSGRHDAVIVVGSKGSAAPPFLSFRALSAPHRSAEVAKAFDRVGLDSVAKILFTSGSTGAPKGVINTHRMLCSNQQAKAQLWPFLERTPPVIIDWLPWSHTFGGNHNFNLILRNGGTLYIDGGRPVPQLFHHTTRNLREVPSTIHVNVPRGFDMLVSALRADAACREMFFSQLQVMFYAAAALPQNVWEALHELALQTTGHPVPLVSAWGSTETAPLATDCHYQAARSGVIGLPVPGTELKLVPAGDKLEVRVRGPNVTPGYWRRPDLYDQHFDAEGFYCIGDAVRLVDELQPVLGLMFDGRIAEDFKLSSGTWVNVGLLRVRAIAALAPIAQDVVVAGHDQDSVGFLVFPNVAACRALCPTLSPDADLRAVLTHASVLEHLRRGLAALRHETPGSSMHATQASFLYDPPSVDLGEITDKGYLNQGAVLKTRAHVLRLFQASSASLDVIRLQESNSTAPPKSM